MKLLTGLIAASLFTGNVALADSTPNVASVIEKYEVALNAGDVPTILSLYSANPVFMPQHAPAQVGVEAVKGAYEYVFSTIKLNVEFTVHGIEVVGDTAWARTSSAGKTKILANNQQVSEGNNEVFVFKKINNEWKIHRYLFATNQPR